MNQPLTGPDFPTGDFVQGHLSAWEKIYAAFHPGVLHFARELVQDPSVAAGIVTDAFLKLWIQHADLDSPQNIEAFLHIGIQRSSFGYLKQVEQLTPAQLKIMHEAPVNTDKDAATIKAIILGWFDQLPGITADTARLAYAEGLNDIQVAGRLGIPVDQVKDHKLKGMLLIKEQWFSKSGKELAAFRDRLQKAREV